MARNWYVHKDINMLYSHIKFTNHFCTFLVSCFKIVFSCNLLCLLVTFVVQYKLYNLALRLLY